MSTGEVVLTAATFAVLVLEGAKWIYRAIKKDYDWKPPIKLYVFLTPILAFASEPFLAWLGVGEYVIPPDVTAWVKQLVIVAISSAFAFIEYNLGFDKLDKAARDRLRG
jgi:hypothetical protein